jgi:tetratricopeptide (TPR) repeat protein
MAAEGLSKGGGFDDHFTDDPLSGASLGAPPAELVAKPPPAPPQAVYFEMLDEAPRPTVDQARIQPRAASGGGGDPNATRAARDPRVRRAQADESIMFLQAGPGAVGAGAVAEASDKAPIPTYTGAFADVMGALKAGDRKGGLAKASAMRAADAGDVMALVALGEALEATGDTATAERAYGSIVDLFPERADMRRFAGERLDRIHDDAALDLALDTYRKAAAERPDHPSSHRLLAYALLRRGRHAAAFDAIVAGLAHAYPQGRFAGVDQVLRDDVGLLGAAWAHAEPARRAEILARVRAAGGTGEDAPSLRFVLTWETDANDVDLHVWDARGGHAFYEMRQLTSGGLLYADVTTGYGPECFTVRAPRGERAGPYTLKAHYFARGPMGYGMGKVEIIDHDGHGGLTFDERPFVVMNDQAFVELGAVAR